MARMVVGMAVRSVAVGADGRSTDRSTIWVARQAASQITKLVTMQASKIMIWIAVILTARMVTRWAAPGVTRGCRRG